MELNRIWSVCVLVLVTLAVVLAAGGRSAMVIETKGQNLLGTEELRTLQVLPDGATVTIAKGAVLRLSFFKSGRKEKITGPCTVKLGLKSSEKLTGTGMIEVQKARNASTELDDSSNLRRTGGAMQAGTQLVPENTLAFEGGESPVARRVTRRGDPKPSVQAAGALHSAPVPLEFVNLSYAYLTPENAGTIQWKSPVAERLEIRGAEKIVYGRPVPGRTRDEVPAGRLEAGEIYWVSLANTDTVKAQYFRIFSPQEVKDYKHLVEKIRGRESGDPRSLFSELLYLNLELGLLIEARAVAKEAVKAFPDDAGYQSALNELNQKLNL